MQTANTAAPPLHTPRRLQEHMKCVQQHMAVYNSTWHYTAADVAGPMCQVLRQEVGPPQCASHTVCQGLHQQRARAARHQRGYPLGTKLRLGVCCVGVTQQ